MNCSRAAAVLLVLLAAGRVLPGEPAVRITQDGKAKRDLAITPDGKQLVFAVQETPTLFALVAYDLERNAAVRLHPEAATSEWEPAFSRDGRLLAFVQSRGNLSLKLVIRDRMQNTEAVFDPGGGFATMMNPVFTPDGSRVLFSYPDGGRQEVVAVRPDGSGLTRLTDAAGISGWPAVSPDGRQIAFASSRDGNFELYLMAADGTGVRRLTDQPGRDLRPAFSPDGKQLAWTSHRDGNFEIYLQDLAGTTPRNLTRHPDRDDYAVWHPSGRWVYYLGERGGRTDVYRLDLP